MNSEVINADNLFDFTVDVESGRMARVLQITDIQIIDAAQKRFPNRLGDKHMERWATDTTEENYKRYVREVIERTEPDLIIMTGDLVYGEFDDNGSALLGIIEFMDSFGIPWAPVFGNHDNESEMGVDWQSKQLEGSQYCLFKQRKLTGNGNYTVAIRQGGVPTRVFYMLDSNGCYLMSNTSLLNGHSKREAGFGEDQIEWYSTSIKNVKNAYPDVKISFAFHIQLSAFKDSFRAHRYDPTEPVNLGLGGDGGDFGYLGSSLKSEWDKDHKIWNDIRRFGVDSVFVGHEHANSISLTYEGIRLQYGQKSSTYDRANYDKDGKYICSYFEEGMPVVGGNLIPLSEDGTIVNPSIILV